MEEGGKREEETHVTNRETRRGAESRRHNKPSASRERVPPRRYGVGR